jgi:hypothetical protein
METRPTSRLIVKREAYRLWFEYLKVAIKSENKRVKSALQTNRAFYGPWQIDVSTEYHSWWKTHGHLFEEKYQVRELKSGEERADPDALVVEIPLTESPTILLKRIKVIIGAAYEAQEQAAKKSKKKPSANYRLSDDAEPKLAAVREMLTVYRDVHLKNPTLKGERLLESVHKFYLGRKNKQWAKVPTPLLYASGKGREEDLARALRNLRRYIQKAEKILLNVASGQFPGEY